MKCGEKGVFELNKIRDKIKLNYITVIFHI